MPVYPLELWAGGAPLQGARQRNAYFWEACLQPTPSATARRAWVEKTVDAVRRVTGCLGPIANAPAEHVHGLLQEEAPRCVVPLEWLAHSECLLEARWRAFAPLAVYYAWGVPPGESDHRRRCGPYCLPGVIPVPPPAGVWEVSCQWCFPSCPCSSDGRKASRSRVNARSASAPPGARAGTRARKGNLPGWVALALRIVWLTGAGALVWRRGTEEGRYAFGAHLSAFVPGVDAQWRPVLASRVLRPPGMLCAFGLVWTLAGLILSLGVTVFAGAGLWASVRLVCGMDLATAGALTALERHSRAGGTLVWGLGWVVGWTLACGPAGHAGAPGGAASGSLSGARLHPALTRHLQRHEDGARAARRALHLRACRSAQPPRRRPQRSARGRTGAG